MSARSAGAPAAADPSAALLDVDGLDVVYPGVRNMLGRRRPGVAAVSGASFSIRPGETLGLVGESGSGKSTIGRAILGFIAPTAGTIRVADFDVGSFGADVPRAYRRMTQVVFQDPVASLNPSMTVGQLIGEPLRIHFGLDHASQSRRATELLERVGLTAGHLDRRPFEFSGGQRQRIAIARALATEPRLVVLDEPVSALDVTTQSQVINLLEELQVSTGATYLFIAHDLAVVRHISHRIAVMYRGRIVETGTSDEICASPSHPYSQLLLASVLVADVGRQRGNRARRRALAAPAAATSDPNGCAFAPRCPHVMPICDEVPPPLRPTAPGRQVACHLAAPVAVQVTTNGSVARP